jgi:hypothetical protein
MVEGVRTRGRKPAGYVPVASVSEIVELVVRVEGAEG